MTIRQLEQNIVELLRNNVPDPDNRGTEAIDLFSGDGLEDTFTLTNTLVRNIKTVKINIVLQPGYGESYEVTYGEGNAVTTIKFNTPPPIGVDNIEVVYHYGDAMIWVGFMRDDVKLPRAAVMLLTSPEEAYAIGQRYSSGKATWRNTSFRVNIRSKYAGQCKDICDNIVKTFELNRRIYRALNFEIVDEQNFDFDEELRWFMKTVTVRVKYLDVFA